MTRWSDEAFTPDELEAIRPWAFPDVTVDEQENEAPEVEEDEEAQPRPTAEELESIISEAQAQGTEQGLKEGRERGFMEGYKKGEAESRAKARDALQQKLNLWDGLLSSLESPLDQLDQSVEADIVTLAIAVAQQLIRREIKQEPGEIIPVVREALAALPSTAQNIVIQLHPNDVKLVRETYAEAGEESRWKIEEDAGITTGGCVIRSDTSRVDASLETRLNSVITKALGGDRQEDQR